MADGVSLTLRPKANVKPLDSETAERIGRVARADTVQADAGAAVFGFAQGDAATVRGNLEMAARFELGAHWQTRYDVVAR